MLMSPTSPTHDRSAVGIAGTNGIPFHHRSAQYGGIFFVASRFNHACDCNACYKWNSTREQLTVHATRSIGEGEEVCINYGGFLTGTEQRQALHLPPSPAISLHLPPSPFTSL